MPGRFLVDAVCPLLRENHRHANVKLVHSYQYPILLWLPVRTPYYSLLKSPHPHNLPLQKPLQWFRTDPEARLATDTVLFTRYISEVNQQRKAGTARDSLAKYALDVHTKEQKLAESADGRGEEDGKGMSEVQIAFALSAPFVAGVDTVCVCACKSTASRIVDIDTCMSIVRRHQSLASSSVRPILLFLPSANQPSFLTQK